jgi:uncharacterized protein YbjT (DUF2867 family)
MDRTVLVTGGTGYVGGRLIESLERRGFRLRCLARSPEALRARVRPGTEVVGGDVLDAASLDRALAGVDTAFYLVHSMGATRDFAGLDRQAAARFGEAARRAGVGRIIYLGGLGDDADDLSPHLRSRHETGELLRRGGVPVIELRASIVIGSGSLSFEMVRALTERLPVMICPRWVSIQAQPIAIDDVVAYLVEAIGLPAGGSRVFEIGGPDVVSYGDIMQEYARQRRLRRLMIPVPLLTPHLSSLWLGLVTPLYARVGRKLISGIRNATIVRNAEALRSFRIVPVGLRDAIARAIQPAPGTQAANRWSDARSAGVVTRERSRPATVTLRDERSVVVEATPTVAFAPIRRIGGRQGWYAADVLWRLRGALDLLAGGVGMRRGRRDPESLRPGDAIDFWRVEAVAPGRQLRLRAEMKVPGRAWLQFDVEPVDAHRSRIRQTATFETSGPWGPLYWYALLPLHAVVFSGMLRGIARRALADAGGGIAAGGSCVEEAVS